MATLSRRDFNAALLMAAGSARTLLGLPDLAWAGVFNTFFWIDPKRKLCAVLMMQFLPFGDEQAIGLLGEFEKAVYAA
jgi:CubicO group peptidase (beta-lactamase class C family)